MENKGIVVFLVCIFFGILSLLRLFVDTLFSFYRTDNSRNFFWERSSWGFLLLSLHVFKAWATAEGLESENLEHLCNDPRAKVAVLADMDAVGREAQLRGFEFAKAVTLVLEPFNLENGLLTPTFKIKRPQAKAYFAKAIADMYAKVATSDPSTQKLL